MASEDAFMGAKTALTLLDAYVNTVAQEIGMERAIALMTKMCEFAGAMQGKMMKEQSVIKEFDAKAAWSLVKSFKDRLGESYEVLEESPQRVVVRNGRCPIYEAAQTLGMDAKTIETSCRAGPMRFMDAAAKQLNPNLSLRVREFRSTPDGFCDEEIVLG
jgi:hypothetical protein